MQEKLKEGLEEGIEQGIKQKENEIVISMHQNNLTEETIAKYVNLTVDEVKKIIDKNSN